MERIIKFGLIGVLNTVITMFVYNGLVLMSMDYKLANICGYIAGMMNSYIWNNNWVFKAKSKKISTFYKFVFVNLISLTLNSYILVLMVQHFNVNKTISQIPAILGSMVVNYIINSFWTFREIRNEA